MSLPTHPTSPSSSLTRSSIHNLPQTATTALAPHLESTLSRRLVQNEENSEDSAISGQKGAGFQPFFTLIEHITTSEHCHPTVHYIFADDDPDIITEAACYTLVNDELHHNHHQEEGDCRLLLPTEGVKEHFVLVDIQCSEARHGYNVSKAHSLSSEWQIWDTSISNAPTMDGDDVETCEGLMLKIEGMGPVTATEVEHPGKTKEKETLSQMVERFEKGLVEVRKMVITAEEKQSGPDHGLGT